MTFESLTNEQKLLYDFIDNLLWEEWDPIGVNDIPDARDEYQNYTPQLFSLVIQGGTIEDVAQKLLWIEREMIGLFTNKEKRTELATKIVEAVSNLKLT